jgi:hypothetical protein
VDENEIIFLMLCCGRKKKEDPPTKLSCNKRKRKSCRKTWVEICVSSLCQLIQIQELRKYTCPYDMHISKVQLIDNLNADMDETFLVTLVQHAMKMWHKTPAEKLSIFDELVYETKNIIDHTKVVDVLRMATAKTKLQAAVTLSIFPFVYNFNTSEGYELLVQHMFREFNLGVRIGKNLERLSRKLGANNNALNRLGCERICTLIPFTDSQHFEKIPETPRKTKKLLIRINSGQSLETTTIMRADSVDVVKSLQRTESCMILNDEL